MTYTTTYTIELKCCLQITCLHACILSLSVYDNVFQVFSSVDHIEGSAACGKCVCCSTHVEYEMYSWMIMIAAAASATTTTTSISAATAVI
jgi:hypothetical protein